MCLEGNSPHNTDCTQSVLYTWAFQNLPPSLASMSFNNLAAVWGSMECTCAPQGTCIAAVLLQFNSFTLEPTLFECTFMFPEWAFKFYPFKFVKSSGLSLLLRSTHSFVYVKWSPPEPHMKLGQMVTSGGGRRHQIIIVAKVYQIKRERDVHLQRHCPRSLRWAALAACPSPPCQDPVIEVLPWPFCSSGLCSGGAAPSE